MRFHVDGVDYRIRFEHAHEVKVGAKHGCVPLPWPEAPDGWVRATTWCFLERRPPSGAGWMALAALPAACSLRDIFSRPVGRRLSFERVMDQIGDRFLRTAAWKAFLGASHV